MLFVQKQWFGLTNNKLKTHMNFKILHSREITETVIPNTFAAHNNLALVRET